MKTRKWFFSTEEGLKDIWKQNVVVAQPPLPQINHCPSFLLPFWNPSLSQLAGDTSGPLFLSFLFVFRPLCTLPFPLPLDRWLKWCPLHTWFPNLCLKSCFLFLPSEFPLASQESCAQTALVYFPESTYLFLLMPLTFYSYLESESWIWIRLCLFLSPLSWINIFQALGLFILSASWLWLLPFTASYSLFFHMDDCNCLLIYLFPFPFFYFIQKY